MKILLLAPLYVPPVEYFNQMSMADLVVIDTSMRHDKRFKAVHRTRLRDQNVTVPVTLPGTTHCRWDEVKVSPHGRWWHVQRSTMSTLFGSTPFFDLYKHDIFPLIDEGCVGQRITDLNVGLIVAVRRLLNITAPLSVTLDERQLKDHETEIVDMRNFNFYNTPGAVSVLETLFTYGRI